MKKLYAADGLLLGEEPLQDLKIQCWPNGRPGECDATIPDTNPETMEKHGWGFCYAPDNFSDSGIGPYFACPIHKNPDNE